MRGAPSDAAVSRPPARPGSGGTGGSQRGGRWPPGWLVVVLPALAELIVGGYRIGGPSLWRDEAATISGSQRPVFAIATMVQHEDAVHGPYYLLMHLVIAAGGISATTLRLPSLIAMCLAVGLTAALGRRLAQASGMAAPQTAGLLAGLALAAVPLTTRYAQEARPYALTTLFAVLATYLLVRAVASPRWPWWVLYAAALVLTGLFSLASMLLVGAHLVSLLAARRTSAGGRRAGGADAVAPRARELAGGLHRGSGAAHAHRRAQRGSVSPAELGADARPEYDRDPGPRLRRVDRADTGGRAARRGGLRRRTRPAPCRRPDAHRDRAALAGAAARAAARRVARASAVRRAVRPVLPAGAGPADLGRPDLDRQDDPAGASRPRPAWPAG